MKLGFFIAVGIIIFGGIIVMLCNFIERPTNDGGAAGDGFVSGRRENHPVWPPENERLSHKFRRWWEL